MEGNKMKTKQNLQTVEDQLMLFCVKVNVNHDERLQMEQLILQVTDWDYFLTTVIERGMAPICYKVLPLLSNHGLIPEKVNTQLLQVYYKTLSRSLTLYEYFRKVISAFNQAGIGVVGLKGIYLSESLYHDVGLRQFSDIDLLVKEADGEKSLHILEQLGYVPASLALSKFVQQHTERVHYPPMVLRGVSIEIHTKLHKSSEDYRIDLQAVWERVVPVIVNGVSLYALDRCHQLIHLCLHLDKHFRAGHVQFTCFMDVANFLDLYGHLIKWDQLIALTKSYRSERQVFKYIILVQQWMHVNIPERLVQVYGETLTNADVHHFFQLLHGQKQMGTSYEGVIKNLIQMSGFIFRVRYALALLSPSVAFMKQRYGVKHDITLIWYYFYRWMNGFRALTSFLFLMIRRSKN